LNLFKRCIRDLDTTLLKWFNSGSRKYLPLTRCQFHQHFMLTLLYESVFLQLFSNYSLALLLFGKRILAQKLLVKCWLNLLLATSKSRCHFRSGKKGLEKITWYIRVHIRDFGGLVLGSSQFLLLPKKVLPNSKVVKIDSKTII
jgi:hypothetical protein